ncbi:MAG TPA: bifunctional adenosylcobinamide kinase/adenosylcobinamide-phosphate guanylyltransferase [Thermoclostridium sp.]|nr:bifunctional adenosylcobinamide kinase/adenosylcobinamide-phosphate guanylyltransferase [Thermoclostridium sp.]
MRILLTGGSACGKSTYAEELAMRFSLPRYYIATMRVFGEEGQKKVEQHRQMRKSKNFITKECDRDIHRIRIPQHSTVLLECMCNLTANEMFDCYGNIIDVHDKILSGVESVAAQCDNIIVVTNDVGSDGVKYDKGTQEYIKTLGRLNIALAESFDCVYELVCGIPLVLKGSLL